MGDVYFRAFYSYLEQMEDLNDAEFGRVMKAAMIYAQSGEKPCNLSPAENMAFKFIKWNVDNSNAKDSTTSKARSDAANKRWGDKNKFASEKMQTDANHAIASFASEEMQKVQTDANDTEEEKEKEEEEIKSISDEIDSAPTGAKRIPYKEITDLFNSICISLPPVKHITDKRRSHIRKRWEEHPSLEYFEDVFKRAEESNFLAGRSTQWQASFDWLMLPTNQAKVAEGNYTNPKAQKGDFEDSSFNSDEFLLSALNQAYGNPLEITEEETT